MVGTQVQASGTGLAVTGPSRRWYLLAAVLLAAALALTWLGVGGMVSVTRQVEGFQRVPAPGESELFFPQPGRYVIYVEKPGSCCSFSFGSGGAWSMNLALVAAGTGRPVAVSTWRGMTQEYGVSGHQGQTAMSFTITHPGMYLLDTRDVTPRAITDLAVGRPISQRMIFLAVLAILAALGALTAAGLVFAITASRRRRARRAPPLTAFAGPVPGWGWPAWPPPPAGAAGPVATDFAGPPPGNPVLAAAAVPATAERPASPRPSRRVAGWALGAAAIALLAVLATVVALDQLARPGTARPGAHPAAAARRASPPAATPAGAVAGPFAADQRWLRGLGALDRQMNTALPDGTITPASLSLTAARLSRCQAELAALGPPPSLYRQTHRIAAQACAEFDHAARLAAAASRAYTTAGTGPAARAFNQLLNRLDAAVNHGTDLIDRAYYGAPVIAP
jgi:hypothetical protein